MGRYCSVIVPKFWNRFVAEFIRNLCNSVQSNKYGMGAPKYSISWSDIGVLVQFRLDALIVTLTMDENANLGLIDDHLGSLQRILKPFSSSNFINHHV